MIENDLKFLRAYFRAIPKTNYFPHKSSGSVNGQTSPASFSEMVRNHRASKSLESPSRGWDVEWQDNQIRMNFRERSAASDAFSGTAEFRDDASSRFVHFQFELIEEIETAREIPGTLRLEFSSRLNHLSSTDSGQQISSINPGESPRALVEELLAALPQKARPAAAEHTAIDQADLLQDPDFSDTVVVLQGILDHLHNSISVNRPAFSPSAPLPVDAPRSLSIPRVDLQQQRDEIDEMSLKIYHVTERADSVD